MTDEETELRVLLERVVPHLPAPAQRWERVRERVRRRRRRRAVALSGTAVLAVAAAGLLLPGAGGPSGAPAPGRITSLAPPASGASPITGGPTPSTTPSTGPTVDQPSYRRYAFADLTGLALRLPPGWRTLTPHGSRTVYISSQALGLPPDGCAHPLDDFCTPLAHRLEPGGILMKLELSDGKPNADKFRLLPRTVGAESVVPACRAVGGGAQLGTTIVDGTGSAVVVATVCLSDPLGPQESRVRDVLMAAEFT